MAAATTTVTMGTMTIVTPVTTTPVRIRIHQLSGPVQSQGHSLDLVPVMVPTATNGVTVQAALRAVTAVVAVEQPLRDNRPLPLVNLGQTIHYRLRALKGYLSGCLLTAAEIMV